MSLIACLILFWLYCAAHRILVPQPGIKPLALAVEVWILNHWTAKEVCLLDFLT